MDSHTVQRHEPLRSGYSTSDHSSTHHDGTHDHPVSAAAAHSQDMNKDVEHDAGEKGAVDASPDPSTAADQASPADRPRLGEESFWSPRLKAQRKAYLAVMCKVTLMVCVLVWAIVSIYWGSLYKQYDRSPHLPAWIINRDAGGVVGDALQNAMLASNNGPKPHPTWYVIDAAEYPTQADIDYEVIRKLSTYIVMEVQPNATQRLQQAQRQGDASWNPQSVVSLTYASARNAQVVPSLVLAPAQQTLNRAIVSLSSQLTASFFQNPPANVAALVSRAPQTVASPIVVELRDVRRYDEPIATAVLLVGLIYIMILAFNVTMANFAARQPFQPFLRFGSLVAMRFIVPLVAYFFISLMMSLLSIPFKLDYGRAFSSYGVGFMVWWATTFTGMAVLGLITETLISLVGPSFMGFALISVIVINVSVSNADIVLSPSFYKYGYAMPFYNIRSVYNIITFDVGQHVEILKFHGILWAWLAVIFLTFPIWIWRERRAAAKARANGGGGGGKPPGGAH